VGPSEGLLEWNRRDRTRECARVVRWLRLYEEQDAALELSMAYLRIDPDAAAAIAAAWLD
jgi:hypothetical protein